MILQSRITRLRSACGYSIVLRNVDARFLHNLILHVGKLGVTREGAASTATKCLHERAHGGLMVTAHAGVARALRRGLIVSLKLDDVRHEVDDILAAVLKEHLHGLIDELVVHEGAIDAAEVVFEGAGKGQTHVDNFVAHE